MDQMGKGAMNALAVCNMMEEAIGILVKRGVHIAGEKGEKPKNGKSQEKEIGLDNNICYSSDERNNLHRAKDRCCCQSFDDNGRRTNKALNWI